MVAKVDMDGSGLLNFPEFLAMMGFKVSQAAHKCRCCCTYFIDNVQISVKWFGLGTQMRAHMNILTDLQILTVSKMQAG